MKSVFGILLFCFVFSGISAQNYERPVQPDLPGEIMIDLGFNFLYDHPSFMNTKFFPSRSFGVYYQQTFKVANWFTVNPGIGIGNDRLGWKEDVNFIQDSARVFSFDTISDISLNKNLLTFTYLEVPLELRFYPFHKTNEGEGFFVSVGGIVGLKIDSHTKIKYDFSGDSRKEKQKGDFGLNDFRFQYIIRMGWKPVNIYGKVYVTDLFQKGPLGANPSMFSIGLNFTGF